MCSIMNTMTYMEILQTERQPQNGGKDLTTVDYYGKSIKSVPV